MLRIVNLVVMLLTLIAVFALYVVKYETRQLEAKVTLQERDLAKLENDVSVLIAERAHLSRPEVLEPLARNLGLAPIAPGQYLAVEMPPRQQ